MSDLAPFVAATIRDRTVMNLHEELKQLQAEKEHVEQQLADRTVRLVAITGTGGSPVYAERHTEQAERDYFMDGDELRLDLNNSTGETIDPKLTMCNVRDIEEAEIHIGGKRLCAVGEMEMVDTLASVGDTYMTLLYSYDKKDESDFQELDLILEFGPMPEDAGVGEFARFPEEFENEDIPEVRFTRVHFGRGLLSP